MDAFSACGRRFSDGKPFAKPFENGGQNVEFSAGAGRGRRIWHDMARIAENRFPHRKTVWRVAVENLCPPGKTGSFTPFPQSFPHPAKGDFFTGKIAECTAVFRFPVFLHTGFPPLSTTSPQPVENSVETVGKRLGGRGKGVCVAFCATLADFALIRHWRATFPTRGKASFDCAKSFMFCFLTDCKIGAESNDYELPKAAFPFEGEGGAKRRMRAVDIADIPSVSP